MKDWTKPELIVLGVEATKGNASPGTTEDRTYKSGKTNRNNGGPFDS